MILFPFDSYSHTIIDPTATPAIQQIDIEYDQQSGQNLFDDILYLDGSIGKSDIIDAAFAPALLKMAFNKDMNHQNIQPQTIDFIEPTEVAGYIFTHHSNTGYKYLCSVEKLLKDDGNEALGVSTTISTNQGIVVKGIFVAYPAHFTVEEPNLGASEEGFRRQILTSTLIHELGHHLGISGHEGHEGNIFCVMYNGKYPEISYQKRRDLYSNPHFCKTHVNFLENNY